MNQHRLRRATKHAAMFASLLAITSPAFGAEVYGTVTVDGRPFVGTLTLPDGSQIQIANGEYRIFLPAGIYPVVFEQNGQRLDATIQSSSVPVSQDIRLVSPR